MCYYRAGLCAEIQGKEIHLVLLYRIGYWDRMSNLYATDNKVNVNQSNMKLKYILNAIIFVLALSFLSMCIFKTTELSLKCMQFAVSISCIGAMFSTKRRCVVMHDAPLFLFITIQICSLSLSCELLKISLIYVFPASKNSSCKLIKQSNQPVHTLFCQFCTHLFYIEGNG